MECHGIQFQLCHFRVTHSQVLEIKKRGSIVFLQPLLQDGAVLVGLFDEAGVTGSFEDLPAAVGDVLVERGSHHRGADISGATANQAGLLNLVEAVGVLEIGQVA